jgi:hypothetical protein
MVMTHEDLFNVPISALGLRVTWYVVFGQDQNVKRVAPLHQELLFLVWNIKVAH